MGLLLSTLLAAAPASGLEPFFFFVGDWTCSGDVAAEWSWSVSKPDEVGQIIGSGETATAEGSLKVFRDTFSYGKEEKKKLMHVVVFHAASGVEALSTDGWAGDKLVFAGDLRQANSRVRVRETFKRWGDEAFTQIHEQELLDGSWKVTGTANCRRVSAGH
ncbi:MAG: hypothetical protein ACJ790_04595 [Myxococcaceae bacterium]